MPNRWQRLEKTLALGAMLVAVALPSAAADLAGHPPSRIHVVRRGDRPREGTGGWRASAIRQAFMNDMPASVAALFSHLLGNSPGSPPGPPTPPPVPIAPPAPDYSTGNAAMVNPNG